MAHKALCKIMLYKALKFPLIRPRKSLYIIVNYLVLLQSGIHYENGVYITMHLYCFVYTLVIY